jgi:predicted ArsR family transcriptional regulator
MHEFMESFKLLVLFNTIAKITKENPDGLTHSDLIAMDPHIPRTRISRGMTKLTKDGYLLEKEIKNEIGRPTKYYSLTSKGSEKQRKLKENIMELFTKVQNQLVSNLSEVDLEQLPKRRFDHISHIIENSEDTPEEKLENLGEIKEELEMKLKRVSDALKELKKLEKSS